MTKRLLSKLIFTFGAILVALGGAMLASALIPSGVSLAMPPAQREPFTDTTCLDCHTDRARLTELIPVVAEDQEAESLSSGPG